MQSAVAGRPHDSYEFGGGSVVPAGSVGDPEVLTDKEGWARSAGQEVHYG